MEMIIDAHVHPYLTSDQNISLKFFGKTISPQQFVKNLHRAGVSRFAGSVIRQSDASLTFEEIHELNKAALSLKEIFGDSYTPGIHIHPDYLKESCQELEWFHQKGGWLIGELVWYMMGYQSYMQSGGQEIFKLAQKLHMVVSIHPTTNEDIEKLANAFPDLPVIVAHPGDKQTFLQRLALMKKYPNLYQDLSGTGIFRDGLLRYGIDQIGSDRLIYGSDYPICNPGMYVAAVRYEELTDTERQNVFSENFMRLEAFAQK